MTPQRDATLEAEKEVLADRLDRLEHAPVDRSRDARRLAARVRRRSLDPLAYQHLQVRGRPVECVPLWHEQ